MVAYIESGFWQMKLCIGTIANDSIIKLGRNEILSYPGNTCNGISISILSDSTFLLSYSTNYSTELLVCKVDKYNHISLGESFTLKDDLYYIYSQVALSADKFLVAYYNSDTDYGTCALGRIDKNLTISMEQNIPFTGGSISNSSYMSMDTLSKSTFVITFNGNNSGRAVIGGIDTVDNIKFGASMAYTRNESYYAKVVSLTSEQFAVIYSDDYWAMKGAVVLGTVNAGRQLTFTPSFYFNEIETRGIGVDKLSDKRMIIAFNSVDSSYLIETDINMNNVEFSNRTILNTKGVFGTTNFLEALNQSKFILLYTYTEEFDALEFAKIGFLNQTSTIAKENNYKSNYSIYPIPTNSHINIRFSDNIDQITIRLFDFKGENLIEKKLDNNFINLDLAKFQKGIYYIQIQYENNIKTQKIIIQ